MTQATTGQNGNNLWNGFDLSGGIQVEAGLNNEIIKDREKTKEMVWKEMRVGDLIESKMPASINLLGRKIMEDGYLVTKKCKMSKVKHLYFIQVDNYDYKVIGRKFTKVKRLKMRA